MNTRTKTRWATDSRGRYSRRIGWKRNAKGQRVQHCFYLGTDLKKAQQRENCLVELWDHIETETAPDREAEWNSLTLRVGRELAKGNRYVVIERDDNSPEAFARYLHRLQSGFPMVQFVPEEPDKYQEGKAKTQGNYDAKIAELHRANLRSGNLLAGTIAPNTELLHDAIDSCIQSVRREYLLPGTTDVTAYGLNRIANMERLKERHSDMPLASLNTFDSVQAMITFWRNRPMVKNSNPPKPIERKTAQHHISELKRFLKWLHRSHYSWRKVEDFDELVTTVPQTTKEKQERLLPSQIKRYSIDDLKLLNEYATPMERLLLLLGLNCGFGPSEQGQMMLKNLFLNQTHPHAEMIQNIFGYESATTDSFFLGARPKNGVYGEFLLWSQTVEMLKWLRSRREGIGEASPDAVLLVSDRGKPFYRLTAGGNRAQRFSRIWCDLTKRIQADHAEFPKLSFGKLRKTAGDIVRQISDGETASVFLCHGRPVGADELLEVYTNRPFGRLFDVLKQVEKKLQPIFDAAPSDIFSQPTQQYTGLKTIKRLLQLHQEGKSVRSIAEEVGLSKSAVYRHLEREARKDSGKNS